MIFVNSILIGLLYALIPGGTILVGLHLAVTRGYVRAAPFPYGVLIVDVIYALLAVCGADAATAFIRRGGQTPPLFLLVVQASLILGLCGYGAFLLLQHRPLMTHAGNGKTILRNEKLAPSGWGVLLVGISMKAATVASPSFLAGFALLTSHAQDMGLPEWTTFERLQFALGFGLGNFIYLQFCMRAAARLTQRIQYRLFMRIQKGTGLVFAALGGFLLFYVMRAWTS